MKKIFKEFSIYSLPFISVIVILIFVNIVKKDFIFGHTLHSTYKLPYNWFKEFTIIPINKFFIKLKNDQREHLSQIKLYASYSKINSLTDNLPNSTKVWKSGKIIHDTNKTVLKDVQFRLRGDNPENWLLEKKSIRIKFKKSEMNGRKRYYNYLPFEPRILISNRLAKKSNLLAPEVRPVEFILNEEKKGLFLELEHFNENFLRRNKFMPVNFYKGENYNQETKIGSGYNLYSNTGLWSKEAYFNFYDKAYNSDLNFFLRILKQSKNNLNKLKTLKTFLDKEYMGQYLAYIVLSQNYHISKYHNNRLVLDTWRGQVFPVITDPDNPNSIELNFDKSSNDLMSILNQDSEFLNLKYKYLDKFIFEDKILINEIEYLKKIKEDVIGVLKNDPTKINIFLDLFDANHNYRILDENILNLQKRQKTLFKELSKNPDVNWTKNNFGFSIIINDQLPINNIELIFDQNTPEWVYIDENYNGAYDKNEVKFFKKNDKIYLDVSLFANRINLGDNYELFYDNITTSSTKFNLITSNKSLPKDVRIKNYFSKKSLSIKYDENLFGSRTNLLNKVLFNSNLKNKIDFKVLSGKIIVNNDLIFEEPVKIMPGTIFFINKNKNIFFKNKVEALGKKDDKIIFKASSRNPWGTVAVLGKKSSGSKFNFIEFYDGSGNYSEQYTFTSMFSLHNTSDIELKNINFNNNHKFDDMLHVIYSSDVRMDNLSFFNAFGDAIDIDICDKIEISNSSFYNSKNDGIDLMESNVDILNVNILNSQDKAISIGEASTAKIKNSTLEKNKTAIAVKDKSTALIQKVNFLNNESQISAYKKNLQYGAGGKAEVNMSIFKGKENKFFSSESKILIKNSEVVGKLNKKGKQISIYEGK